MYTICPYCGCGCRLAVKRGQIFPDKKDPISAGKPCFKGLSSLELRDAKDRLLYPMLRKGKKLVRASWDEAFEHIISHIGDLRGNEVGFVGSGAATNEANYLLQKLARNYFCTENIDSSARLCHATTCYALARAVGLPAMPAKIDDVLRADLIAAFGTNPHSDYPVLFQKILSAQKRGRTFIVIDEYRTDSADHADLFIQISPGTFIALINGLIAQLIKRGLRSKLSNFDELAAAVKDYNPARVCEICGISEPEFYALCEHFEHARKPAILWGMTLTQHAFGVDNVLACANLALLKNGYMMPMRGKVNIQGAGDVGCAPRACDGLSHTIIDFMILNPAKALYIMQMDPAKSLPYLTRLHKLLKEQFVILQSCFPNITMQFADVVLPNALFIETSGTITNAERRLRSLRAIFDPPAEVKQDWQIILELANKLGLNWRYENVFEITQELIKVIPAYRKLSLKKIFGDGDFADKKIRFKRLTVVHHHPPEERRSRKFPFVLTTFRVPAQFCTAEFTSRTSINKIEPEPLLRINPDDAHMFGLKKGDTVKVSSRYGQIKVKIKLTPKVARGYLAIPFHYDSALVNRLFGLELNPETKEPNYRFVCVRLEKV